MEQLDTDYEELKNACKSLKMDKNPTKREEANAIVAFAFRNGLEEIHSEQKITDEEKKKLIIEACEKVEILLKDKEKNPEIYKKTMLLYHNIYCTKWK